MLKFLGEPLRNLIISVFMALLFYLALVFLASESVEFNDRVFYSGCIGLVIFLTNLTVYVKLIMSYMKDNPNVSLKALSYSEFKNTLSSYHANR